MSEIISDKQELLQEIAKNPEALKIASDQLKSDKEIILMAVLQDRNALKYASMELQNDPEVLAVISKLQNDPSKLAAIQEQREKIRKHTFEEIAQGIKPTPSAIQQIQRETIAEMTRGTNSQYTEQDTEQEQ